MIAINGKLTVACTVIIEVYVVGFAYSRRTAGRIGRER